jgi:hypothetical protein
MRKVAFASAMMTTPFFALFGWTWFYLSALMELFMIMNYIFSVTLRIIGLWKERGFGWWLLSGLWAARYNILLLPTTVVKNIMVFNREQAETALPTPATGGPVPGRTSNVVQPLQGGTGSSLNGTKKPSDNGTYEAADSPYSSANRQLGQAQETLARQQKEAAQKLDNVHRFYEGLLNKPPESERPSAPDWLVGPRSSTTLNCQAADHRASRQTKGRTEEEKPSSVTSFKRRKKGRTRDEKPSSVT